MTEAHTNPFEHGNNPPDFEQRLADLFAENNRPHLPQDTFALALEGYTQDSQNHQKRPYHDGEHPFDVTGRTIWWMEYIADKANIELTLEDYEVATIAPSWHDNKLKEENGVSPEKQSAKVIADKLRDPKYGDRYKKSFIKRVSNAIESTEVKYTEDKVLLTHVLEADPDIVAVSLVLADIGAVLTEDEDKIVIDASKVAAEKVLTLKDKEVAIDEVMAIFDKQPTFTKQRFDEFPSMIIHHLGIDRAGAVLAATAMPMKKQRDQMMTQAALIANLHSPIKERVEPIINNPDLSAVQMGVELAKVVLSIIHSQKG
ncbi:MAG: hypothetical protein JWN75_158 [Candidatus Saccharibacteria bacterium]|nr:hypothetical protein [Candidatus Saccharibacteria bacterium]